MLNLNDTKIEDSKFVYSYLKRENGKSKHVKRTEVQLRKQTADMLHVSRCTVYKVISGKSNRFTCEC